MKKLNYTIIIIIAMLFIVIIPNFSNAANTKVGKVSNLKASQIGTTSVALNWNKVAGITGYRVYISYEPGNQYKYCGTTSTNRINLRNLISGQGYKVRVRAFKNIGKGCRYGEYSNIVKFSPIPVKVTNIVASNQIESSIDLKWNKVNRANGYYVYIKNEKTGKYQYYGQTRNLSISLKDLNSSRIYKISVRAYKSLSGKKYYSAFSDEIQVVTAPKTVNNLKIINTTKNSIKVQWNKVDNVTGYAVYLYKESGQAFKWYSSTSNTSINITNLKPAKFYKIYVKAYVTVNKKNYYSKASNIISQKTDSTSKDKAGIDVSQHQGKIDWDKVKALGVDFAIIRLGWIGNLNNHTLDKQFERNYNECKRLNIPIGVYVYCYSNCAETAESGADWAVKKLQGKKLDLPVFIDMEDSSIVSTGNKNLSNICIAFNTIIEKANFKSGIYANRNWFDNYLDNSLRQKYTCWIAHYTSSDNINYEDTYEIWQYSSEGLANGINGNVDLNVMYIKKEQVDPVE